MPIRWGRIFTVALSGVVSHTFGRTSLSVLVPAMRDELGLSGATTGALGSVNLGFYMAGVVIVTVLAGRVEPFTLLRTGILVVATGLFVLGTATGAPQAVIGTALAGLGGAGIWLTTPIIASERVPPERRGVVLGSLTATMGAAFITIPLGATLLRELADDSGAWREVWLIEGGLALMLLIALSVFVTTESTEPIEGAVAFSSLRRLTGWRPAVGAYMSFAFVAASFALFIGPSLELDHGFSRNHTTLLFSAMGAGSVLGSVSFGRMGDRFGRPRTMTTVMLITAATAVMMPIGSEPWIAVAIILDGASSFSFPTLTATFVRDQVDQREFTAVFGAMTIFYGPASIAGPYVSGRLADAQGTHTATYYLLAAVSLLAALFASRLPRVDHSASAQS